MEEYEAEPIDLLGNLEMLARKLIELTGGSNE